MPKRNVKNKNKYNPLDWPHRAAGPEFRKMKDKRVAEALEALRRFEEMSRPDGGDVTAKHKDRNAFAALACAGELVELLAGWAIDHAVGLGLSGLRWVPGQIPGEKPYFKYLVAKIEVDDHRHETVGGVHSRMSSIKDFEGLDPIVLRQILINLLVRNPGGFPSPIQKMTVEALEALNYSETLPMLKAVESGRKARRRELKLQLEAVKFIEYRCAKGLKRYKAEEEVGEAYGRSGTTVRLWKSRLRKELGELEVSSEIQIAKNIAVTKKDVRRKNAAGVRRRGAAVDYYGPQALKKAAARYQQFIKQIKD